MKPIPLTPEIAALARRIVWFEPPENAASDPVHFMTYALHEEMRGRRPPIAH